MREATNADVCHRPFAVPPVPPRQPRIRHQAVRDSVNVWRSPAAWQVTIFMVLQAMMSFSTFAAALTVIMLRTRDGRTAAHLSGMMQGAGYGLGSTGRLRVGRLRQATGSFTAAGVLFLVGLPAGIFGYRAGRNRFVG